MGHFGASRCHETEGDKRITGKTDKETEKKGPKHEEHPPKMGVMWGQLFLVSCGNVEILKKNLAHQERFGKLRSSCVENVPLCHLDLLKNDKSSLYWPD